MTDQPLQLEAAKTADDVRSNIALFNKEAKRPKLRELVRSIFQQTTYWIYDPDTRKFGPSKFVGFREMTFAKYEKARSTPENLRGNFDGAVARAANEHATGDSPKPNAALANRLTTWANRIAGADVFAGVTKEWKFLALPRLNPSHLPDWTREEVILALDLYRRVDYNKISGSHDEVIALSELLRALPIHKFTVLPDKFRNAAGVHRKLGNLASLDPDYGGRGLSAYSDMDAEIWSEFKDDPKGLALAAKQIRERYAGNVAEAVLQDPEAALANDLVEGEEGRKIARQHLVRERDPRLKRAMKKRILRTYGKLICEACSFDFAATYGKRGEGYIECHHTIPVSTLKDGQKTKGETLVGLCANCHRIVHRKPLLGIDELKLLCKLRVV